MAKIVVVGLQKGGVGKSTIVRNLSFTLFQQGQRVLMVDFDAQANLTMSCGIDQPGELPLTIGNLMGLVLDGEDLPERDEYIRTSDGVDFIPSSKYLSVVENQMRMEMGCDRILSEILEPLRSEYDYILIDIGPTEGILTVNALCAADTVLIPMDLQLFALAGVREILTSVKKLRRRIKPDLEIAGIVFNRYDTITNLSGQIQSDTREAYGGHVHLFQAAIPQTVDIGTAHYCSKPVALAKPYSKATAAFKALATEFIRCCPSEKVGEAPC